MNKKLTILSLTSLFAVGVLTGCQNENSKLAKEVVDSIKIGSDYKQAKGGFTLPSKIIKGGQSYDIEWSDNSDLISVVEWDEAHDKVNVTRPKAGEANVDYTLTANVEVNGKKASKDFAGVISAYEVNPIAYTKVGDIYTAAKAGELADKTFSVTGNIANSTTAGLWVVGEDGEAFFAYGAQASYKKGDNVTLTGTLAEYHTLFQLAKGYSIEGHSRNNEVAFKKYSDSEVSVAEIYDLDPQLGDLIHGKQIKMKGIVSVEKSGQYVNYYIKDLDNASKKHQFYYGSITDKQKDALEAVNGKVVSVNVVYYTNDHDGKAYLDYVDSDELTGTELTAAQQFVYQASSYRLPKTIGKSLPTEFVWTPGTKDEEGKLIEEKATIKYNVLPAGKIDENGKLLVKVPTDEKDIIKLEKIEATITNAAGEEYKISTTGQIGMVMSSLKDVMVKADTETSYSKVEIVANPFGGNFVAKQGSNYFYISDHDLPDAEKEKLAVGSELILGGKYNKYKQYASFNPAEIVSTTKDFTPSTIDYTKAKKIDQKALQEAIDTGISYNDAMKNEVIANNYIQYQMVCVEGVFAKPFETANFNTLVADGIKDCKIGSEGLAEGDKIRVYGIITGMKGTSDGKVAGFTFVGMKTEKIEA